MGDFRMTIEAAGGHGCDRGAKAGDELRGCGQENCPDCMFARFVSDLQRAGMRPTKATMHHWPADMAQHDRAVGHEFTDSETCTRCGSVWGEETQPTSAKYRPCRTYSVEREVIDDYSERGIKYPAGAFRRASGRRVVGSF